MCNYLYACKYNLPVCANTYKRLLLTMYYLLSFRLLAYLHYVTFSFNLHLRS